jgi:hypothetical protein
MKKTLGLSILITLVFSSFAGAVTEEDFVGDWKGLCAVNTESPFAFSVTIKYDEYTRSFNRNGLIYPFGSVSIRSNATGTVTSTAGWDATKTKLELTKAEVWVSAGPKLLAQAGVIDRYELELKNAILIEKSFGSSTYENGTRSKAPFICQYQK